MIREHLLQAWLVACLFWLSLSLGSLAILTLHGVGGGAWGRVIGSALRAAAGTLPLTAVAFLPLALGMETLFVWVREPLPEKALYLNVPFFELRTALYFAIWTGVAAALRVWNRVPSEERLIKRSAVGAILYALSVTWFAIDWIMSLEPHWYSTAIGFVVAASQVAGGFALAILVMGLRYRPDRGEQALGRLQVLGNLLLASILFWAYVAFMQYLIIWSGNLPHEISWYLHRSDHGWEHVVVLLVLFHFALPFVLLLSRRVKRAPRILAGVAGLVLLGRLIDVWWLTRPAFHEPAAWPRWLDLAAVAGLGAIWMALFFWLFRRQTVKADG